MQIEWVLALSLVLALAVFAYVKLAQHRRVRKEQAHMKW